MAIGMMSATPSKTPIFVESTCSQRASGGLSTVRVPAGSKAAYQKLCQDMPIERTEEA